MERTGYITVTSQGQQFLRGDGNTDGTVDISDAIAVLGFLFTGGAAAPCRPRSERH